MEINFGDHEMNEYKVYVDGSIHESGTWIEDDDGFLASQLQTRIDILASPIRGGKDVRAEMWMDGKCIGTFLPKPLKAKMMMFHAIIGEDGSVGFDDCPSLLEDTDLEGKLPADAKLVNHFPKIWMAKSMEISAIVELGGMWWWRVDELEASFWDTLAEKFEQFHVVRKSNVFTDQNAAVAHVIKMFGGFQPEIVK